ncbi:MAG: hypothetical protein JRI23_25090 [Deltaproteobacteria bacterium]|jgi:hypothetical protein|nr:hypothetical protein [Deltaproteobacteria bacterium]MBW2535293.1 hypothetical protein [Deltaproteobacteria bacterium]
MSFPLVGTGRGFPGHRGVVGALVTAGSLLWSQPSLADAIAMPKPPDQCPPGHAPMNANDLAYCEPPPDRACPVGSFWTSMSAEHTFCAVGPSCDARACEPGWTCRESSVCVIELGGYHRHDRVVTGACTSDADCQTDAGAGVPGMPIDSPKCEKARRCDPDDKMKSPALLGPARKAARSDPKPAEPASKGCGACAAGSPVGDGAHRWAWLLTFVVLVGARGARTHRGRGRCRYAAAGPR